MNVYSIDYVVKSAMADCGMDVSSPHYQTFRKWAIDRYRRLNLGNLIDLSLKTKHLAVSEDNTADLPEDYIDWLKIGLCIEGKILNFDVIDDLCLPEQSTVDGCGCSSSSTDEINASILNAASGSFPNDGWAYNNPYWQNGQFVGGLFGHGAGYYHGGYRIDKQNWKIYFDNLINLNELGITEVVLEYRSKGIDSQGNALLEEGDLPAMIAGIHLSRCENSRNPIDRQMVSHWKQTWGAEAKGLAWRKQNNAMSKNQWLTMLRIFTYQSIKR